MAPTLSTAPAPQPGDHVKFLSFFSTSHEYSISNPYLFFFFLLPLPQFGIIYLLPCYFRGPLFTSFPSSVFPIQSGPLLPHSSTLGGSLRPSESRKIFYCRIQGVLQSNSKPSLWPHLHFVPAKPFFILSPTWPAPAFALLLFLPWITSFLLETQLFSQE